MPRDLARAFEERFGLVLKELWGMTECQGIPSVNPHGAERPRNSHAISCFVTTRRTGFESRPPRQFHSLRSPLVRRHQALQLVVPIEPDPNLRPERCCGDIRRLHRRQGENASSGQQVETPASYI